MNFLNKLILFILCIVFFNDLFAQREVNIWYFGDSAGINFNSGKPVPLLDGQIKTWEGVATFSDSLGNLLFYTDGATIWNAKHKIMPNGKNLLGHWSSTESAIITPHPGNKYLYYVFTVDMEAGKGGFAYSVVDMRLDNGLGDVTSVKNRLLFSASVEKVTGVRHNNNKDIWIISHPWNSDTFYVYLIDKNGLNTNPLKQKIGTGHYKFDEGNFNTLGYMRASPDGTKIGVALMARKVIEILEFNGETGILSNPVTLTDPGKLPYGVEFSPDCSKMYYTTDTAIFQLDLTNYNQQSVEESKTFIATTPQKNYWFGALQLATDGKIYVAHEQSYYLPVIQNPNKKGDACNFVLKGFYLGGRKSRLGLPDFIQSYLLPPNFSHTGICFGDSTLFQITDKNVTDSVLWNFGDLASGSENESKLQNPKHKFSKAGLYEIKLIEYKKGLSKQSKYSITINQNPVLSLSGDTIICVNQSLKLNVNQSFVDFIWSTGLTTPEITINSAGKYWVRLTNQFTNCSISDTINVKIAQLPQFTIGADTGYCKFDSVLLKVNYPKASFLWSNGKSINQIYAQKNGTYILRITDSLKCVNYDTVEVKEYPLPVFNIGKDTVLCENTTLYLSCNYKKGKYLWNTTETTEKIQVAKAGNYWLTITDTLNCKNTDTIQIFPKKIPEFSLGNDTTLCEGNYHLLTVPNNESAFLWQNGSADVAFVASVPGYYTLRLTNICGFYENGIRLDFEYCGDLIIPNIITSNNDGVNETFYIKGLNKKGWDLAIFNRWGNLIYETTDYQNNWSGSEVPDGVYFYKLENKIRAKKYQGYFTVRK